MNYTIIKYVVEEIFHLKLLSDAYESNISLLSLYCDICKDHFTMSFKNLNRSKKCTLCIKKEQNEKQKLPFDEVKKIVEDADFKLLDDNYISSHTPITVQCNKCNYIYKRRIHGFRSGFGCIKCGYDNVKNKRKTPFETVKEYIESAGLILLSTDYTNSNTLLKLKCEFNHEFERSYSHIKKSSQCPYCKLGLGIGEEICRNYFEYLFDKPFKKCHPNWLNGLELDGYNQELNLCFERHGEQHYMFIEFFHRTPDEFIKRQEADKLKQELCVKNNVKLIIVPYWIKTNEILDFIKTECSRLKIPFVDKPNIELDKISVYNKGIQEKNNYIDDLIVDSNWIRISNYTGTDTEIMIQCKICNLKTSSVCYYLTKLYKNNKQFDCKNCFNQKKQKQLNAVLNKAGLISLNKYETRHAKIEYMCIHCDHKNEYTPRHIINYKDKIKCDNCSN